MKLNKNALKMLAVVLSKYTDVSAEVLSHPDFMRAANKFVDVVQMIPEEKKMKKSELRNIIREEIKSVLNEKMPTLNRQFEFKGKKYTILKVEDDRFIHVQDEKKNTRTFDYKWLKKQGADLEYKPTKKQRAITWNDKSYKKWIKDMASEGGAHHSYDMAQNAKHTIGLINYVEKQIRRSGGDEKALERIQWDIEAYA